MELQFTISAVMIALIYLRYKTDAPVYTIFASFLSFYLAIDFAESAILLTTVFAVFGFYLLFESFYRGF